ncbi:MAG: SDR family oxidoreductase [Methanospirillum sp.]|uniref:UDP-glucuronic acid decarboxylase family protein n=1 Tax=Methanospirillum sp. TaxID=45200 RepID=UPI00236DB138|nr:UDP-glucuronic acid decarboxylase family protein [Methanospirillum sp.]MDD1728046.1 SDR family oxidoreductase [Methanospirillum sp.]
MSDHNSNSEDMKRILAGLQDVDYQDKTVLVTGGSGFLGSWMCETLLNKGAHVICLDNYASGRPENTDHLLDHPCFTRIEHDISKPFDPERKLDLVCHLASRAGPLEFEHYPIQILKSNTLGTMHALGIAKKYNARLLFTSTSEIYGEAEVFPTPETYRGNVNTLGIRGCYDEAKRAGEAYCMAYHRQHGLDVRIVRIFNTYGPRMRSDGHYGRVIPRFIDQAMQNQPITIFGDGTQTRSFCYVTDQITGLLRLAGLPGLAGEVVNIGNPVEWTILELAKKIIQLVHSSSTLSYGPLQQDDPMRRLPNIDKARKVLGFEPQVGLDEGLPRMTEEFLI